MTQRIGLYLIFAASGVAGLIYQSIWSQYLGLILGHAAYAQALVLAIFMGGMAMGAWLASRWSHRISHALLAYAAVELCIGLLGIVFHGVFQSVSTLLSTTLLPSTQNIAVAHAAQWAFAVLLIAPQCILLGATFPLLSVGVLRLGASRTQTLGGLYFTNSVGAALGALLSGFFLIPVTGLPGTILTAGLLNIGVALFTWLIVRGARDGSTVVPLSGASASHNEDRRLSRVLLIAASITGATSFVYEIGWIRLLNQAVGTTLHAFELMIAAFVLGLSLGGLWVAVAPARGRNPIQRAAHAQILMGISALLSLVAFAQSFTSVEWLMAALARTDQGYSLFNLGTAILGVVVMFPAAFFAGMTLPLFSVALLDAGGGEKAIGRIYAANTVGAIIGVFVMLFLLIDVMGIRNAVALAALFDIGLGLYLLRAVCPARLTSGFAWSGLAAIGALLIAMWWGQPDVRQQSSGVFRTGQASLGASVDVKYFRDGRTATVSVVGDEAGHLQIATNGKPDASLMLDVSKPATNDEPTMVMLGSLSLLLHPTPEDIAVIGWGSGMTINTLASSSAAKRIDAIEIEPAMYQGSTLFRQRLPKAFSDKRVHLQIDDARTFLALGNKQYDVIISEPSNPWVSGVSSLFTKEFYKFSRAHLKPNGMFVQWLHAYELSDKLLASMIAALLEEYPASELYLVESSDLVIVARTGQASLQQARLDEALLKMELERVKLASSQEYEARYISGPRMLATYAKLHGGTAHSDYFPTVALAAPRSRFKGEVAIGTLMPAGTGMPVLQFLERRKDTAPDALAENPRSNRNSSFSLALKLRDAIRAQDGMGESERLNASSSNLQNSDVAIGLRQLHAYDDVAAWSNGVAELASKILGYLPPEDQTQIWSRSLRMDDKQMPDICLQLLEMYADAASRDAAKLQVSALKVLSSPMVGELAPQAREQALILAQLAAIRSGREDQVPALEKEFGSAIAPSERLGPLRSFLLAWVDTPAPR